MNGQSKWIVVEVLDFPFIGSMVACTMWIDVTSTAWKHKITKAVWLGGYDGSSSSTTWWT